MITSINAVMEALPDGLPEYVHLLPAGTFSGIDGRGPYRVDDASDLIKASMLPGRKLPIDINHAIDLTGKGGNASPAVGWIVSLESRSDGIWGEVSWTATGAKMVGDRDYGYLSPVFAHTKEGQPLRVKQLYRAALTNDPNLVLSALHHSRHGAAEAARMEAAIAKLSESDLAICQAMGLHPDDFAATRGA